MKYPQLVSSRAVNAISDWLVSRLEQLGVESPLIYSRLLLSLLQSSIQLNDPIEFNNLETFLANRKGGNCKQRYPPSDSENLKKLYAVHCFMQTVSSEFEVNTVEKLVDELCCKLREIEQKDEDDDETSEDLKDQQNSSTRPITKTDTDPAKRYYNAFPALSKDMEDSIGILKGSNKTLTWPKANQKSDKSQQSTAATATTVVPQQTQQQTDLQQFKQVTIKIEKITNNYSNLNCAGVKRKPKRRRNQGNSKISTKTAEQIEKNPRKKSNSSGSSDTVNSRIKSSRRNCSSPTWDTDFEGSWEMGRDLIKEFLVKENNRNRSTSESATYNIRSSNNNDDYISNEIDELDGSSTSNAVSTPTSTSSNAYNTNVDQQPSSFTMFSDEGYSTHENLTMISDIVTGGGGGSGGPGTGDAYTNMYQSRRLYERDVSNSDSMYPNSPNSDLDEAQLNSQTSDFELEQFKAKFNSHVEALWNDAPNNDEAAAANSSHWNPILHQNLQEEREYFSMPMAQPQPLSIWQNDSIWSINESNQNNMNSWAAAAGRSNFQDSNKIEREQNKECLNYSIQPHLPFKWSEGINGVGHNFHSPIIVGGGVEPEYLGSIVNISNETSLPNHCSNASAFSKYSSVKSKLGPVGRPISKPKMIKRVPPPPLSSSSSSSSDDNLLTSSATHFTPIKQNYANGYSFCISADYDDIDYNKSQDGYLLWENKKYLEYKLPKGIDGLDVVQQLSTSSMSPQLKVKFQVKTSEVACQTEDERSVEQQFVFSPSFAQWSDTDICQNCTLWGTCAQCCLTTQAQAIPPANRLLKDELSVEGDEIMANLKCLYIGTTHQSWIDLPSGSETSDFDDDRDDMLSSSSPTPVNDDDYEMETVANELYKNVTKLISDLWKPNDDGGIQQQQQQQHPSKSGGVDGDDDRHYVAAAAANIVIGSENFAKIWANDQFVEGGELNWEYSNLAEIWNNNDLEQQIASDECVKRDFSQRLQSFLSAAAASKTIDSGSAAGKNRKRRHSASQKPNLMNNNNDDGCCNNNNTENCSTQTSYHHYHHPTPEQRRQTIIKCKLWTRKLDSTTDNSLKLINDNNNDIIHNLNNNDEDFSRNKIFIECTKDPLESSAIASALKLKLQHISRPLTR